MHFFSCVYSVDFTVGVYVLCSKLYTYSVQSIYVQCTENISQKLNFYEFVIFPDSIFQDSCSCSSTANWVPGNI